MLHLKRKLNLTVKIITATLMTIFFANLVVLAASAPEENTTFFYATEKHIELNASPLLFSDIKYEVKYSIDSNNALLSEATNTIDKINTAIDSGMYEEAACKAMKKEVNRLNRIITKVNNNITTITSWETEYYYAAKTWQFFTERGYSEVVTSAIIGNMTIETSGGSLDLNPTIYDPPREFYGLCQWSLYYRPEVAGMSFEDQLEYLESDLKTEFNTFGSCYRSGFTYEDFLAMEDSAEAAYAFAKVYERCASWSCGLRRAPAQRVYEYFKLK